MKSAETYNPKEKTKKKDVAGIHTAAFRPSDADAWKLNCRRTGVRASAPDFLVARFIAAFRVASAVLTCS